MSDDADDPVAALTAREHWDLCSWKCAADFASLKALDPETA